MCGITGWIDWEEDLTNQRPVLENMTKQLSARGPDATGFWISERAGIGHRRLIVVDPEGGTQPMVRQQGDETYVLTYNGELYNTAEIRRDLIDKGHFFKYYSDTEVVLVSFIEWGPQCVEHFNGIFAFGIWRDQAQSLFIARDRLGVKPLFYAERGETFLFGSELKALLAHPKVKPELDREGLAEIFGLGPARTPGNGVFRGLKEIRPGYSLIYNRNGLKLNKYWALESKPHPDSLDDTVIRVRELVEDSIERQLVSDVPVCTLLSGGLDSSIISAVAARHYQKEGKKLQTFSIDYVDNDKFFKADEFQPNDDAPWIRRVSQLLETRHNPVFIDTLQLFEALENGVVGRDLPGMADIDASLYLFCREIKKEATVALSGECADEVFGGYPWFQRQEALEATTFPWSLSLGIRNRILGPEFKEKVNLHNYVNDRYQQTLAELPRLSGEDPVEAKRRELFYLNIYWFMQVLLDRKDRMSMASGLEVRVPYCDHRIVEYVWNIPWRYKYCDQRRKGILRRAALSLLPEDVVYREKSPYPKTHNPNYLATVRERLNVILNDPSSPLLNLIDVPVIKEIIQTNPNWTNHPWFGQLMLLPQFFAYLIQVDTWLRLYKVQVVSG